MIQYKTTLIKLIKILSVFTFCLILLIQFCLFAKNTIKSKGVFLENAKEYFKNIDNRSEWIDLYGASQHLLGKQQIEKFTIFKTSYGKLVSPRAFLEDYTINRKYQEISVLFNYLEKKEIPYVYLESLIPIVEISDCPIGTKDFSRENSRRLHDLLKGQGRPTINLDFSLNEMLPKERLFYNTDHHWSNEACLSAYCILAEYIKDKGLIQEINWLERKDFYNSEIKRNCFLGSYGIKAGKYYDGKDDFYYYVPRSSSEKYSFTAYNEKGEKVIERKGTWEYALIDQMYLNDEKYNNKYNVFLSGNGNESRIVNFDCANKKKALLISHSYGRPLAAYIAPIFYEVRLIDTDKDYFFGDHLSYIQEYKPDIVVFLIEFEGEIIGDYSVE